MAASKKFENAKLQIKYDCGLGDNGKTIVKSKSYSDVKETATIDQIMAVKEAINGLVDATYDELEARLITSEHLLP